MNTYNASPSNLAENPIPTYCRSESKRQWLTRLYRWKVLLLARWWIPLLTLLFGIGITATLGWFRAPAFSSVGKMIVNIKLSLPEGAVYSEEMTSFLGTQTALMQSDLVLNRAWSRIAPQLTNEFIPIPALKVAVLPKTTIFVLQAITPNAASAQIFLQACMEEFIQVKKDMRAQTSDTTLAGLTDQILRLEKDLRHSDEELASFQSTNSVEVFQEQGSSAARYLGMLNQRLAGLRSEYELLQTLNLDQALERRQADIRVPVPTESDAAANSAAATDSDYLRARRQITLLKAERQDLGHYLRPKHPRIVAMNEEIERRERLLAIFREQSTEQLEDRKNSLSLQIQSLEKDVTAWDNRALEVSRKNAEYQKLKANSHRIETLYERLLSTMQTLDLNRQINPESVTIMENATPPVRARADFWRQLLIGGVTGLVVSIAILALLDSLDDRMNSLSELQEVFEEEVLAQIPRQTFSGGTHGLLRCEHDCPAFVEAYRSLRSSLLYSARAEKTLKVLLVTSSVPNEGKSLTASNLAIILASAGSRVLLVDADLRKGGLHSLFGQHDQPGLFEVLVQGLDPAEAAQTTSFKNLYLLPRGHSTQASGELFISAAMKAVLRKSAADYDYVILDSAPVMATDDATSLAPSVDGVLFLLRAEQTSARIANAALDLLYQRRANVLGLIFNDVHPRNGAYRYYQYKDYYREYPN